MNEPDDLLAAARDAVEHWDHAARDMPNWPTAGTLRVEAAAKEDAIRALGIPGNQFHDLVAAVRRRHIAGQPGGMSVPDAIQTFINETLREAS